MTNPCTSKDRAESQFFRGDFNNGWTVIVKPKIVR